MKLKINICAPKIVLFIILILWSCRKDYNKSQEVSGFILSSPEIGADSLLPVDYTCDGTAATPFISSVDLLTGTIWTTESAGSIDTVLAWPQLIILGMAGATAGHAANGLLATVTINTAGAPMTTAAPLTLSVVNTQDGPMEFTKTFVSGNLPFHQAPGGSLAIVPEPVSMSMLALGAVGLLLRRRRS